MKFLKFFSVILVGFVLIFSIFVNYIMEKEVGKNFHPKDQKEFAIVLGASVHGDELSEALRGRMEVAMALYKDGFVKEILLSGDGTNHHYSETAAMKKYALMGGIPQENLLTDEKGYNTYLTMLRAHDVFNARSAYVITQNFHLVRAVWVAKQCGIEAQGVGAGSIQDPWYYDIREYFARVKDYMQVVLKI
jgi:SanA protein